jgi:hypothetical protein
MMEWIKCNDQTPRWGETIIAYRGKHDRPEAWQFDLPPLFEITNKFDPAITHWVALTKPKKEKETP